MDYGHEHPQDQARGEVTALPLKQWKIKKNPENCPFCVTLARSHTAAQNIMIKFQNGDAQWWVAQKTGKIKYPMSMDISNIQVK